MIYSDIPWYRREGWNTAFIVAGMATKGMLPLGLVTCLLVLNGGVFSKGAGGEAVAWGPWNKAAAWVFMAAAGWLLWRAVAA